MISNAKEKKIVFFWGDGMGETTHMNTSLEKAKTPNMDLLFQNSTSGFYLPILTPNSTTPKTDIVIPYMYFLSPEEYVGRAALDLIDSGKQIPLGTWVGSFRLVYNEDSNDKLSINTTKVLLEKIHKVSEAVVLSCPTSSHNNIFALICSDRSILEEQLEKIIIFFNLMGMEITQVEVHQTKQVTSPLKDALYFLGWGKGSLRGVFRMISSGVNEFTPKRYCFEEYYSNLELLQKTSLRLIINSHDVLVFYIKETDSASHLGSQKLKVRAIETLDWIIGQVIPFLPLDSRIVVLADHPTNIGSPNSISAPAPFMFADILELSSGTQLHFCEQAIAQNTQYVFPISMDVLRTQIFSYLYHD